MVFPELLKYYWDLMALITLVISAIFLVLAFLRKNQFAKKLLSISLLSSLLILLYTLFGWSSIHADDECEIHFGCGKGSVCPAVSSEQAPCLHAMDVIVVIFITIALIIMVIGLIKTLKKKANNT